MRPLLVGLMAGMLMLPTTGLAGSDLASELGAIEALKPSVYKLKRRAEPTALRSLASFERKKAALLTIAKADFKDVKWQEPGIEIVARLTALREAVYIRLGEWGGKGVEAYLRSELGNKELSDSGERALLRGLGAMELAEETQRVLLRRIEAETRNPQARFETLSAVMKQGSRLALTAFRSECTRESLSSLQRTRLGVLLVGGGKTRGHVNVSEVMNLVVRQAAHVSPATHAAEALWGAFNRLHEVDNKLLWDALQRHGTEELRLSLQKRERWAKRRAQKPTQQP